MRTLNIIVNIIFIGVLAFLVWFGFWGFAMFDCIGGLVFGIIVSIGELVLLILLFRTLISNFMMKKELNEKKEIQNN